MNRARSVHVVVHTHWDREWYEPFERFRQWLVGLLDELIERLESEPGFEHFLLDGQMALVDDYLAVRPAMRDRLAALVRSGRVAVGPWYTLPDEFLVSGETLVRNLERGLETARALGGTAAVGYLPDMFGHIGQMPQLLDQFGFAHAVVWRGVPAAIGRTGFWWTAPDGSTVRAEYLPSGYGNGASLPSVAPALVARIGAWEAEHRALLADDDAILWMVGGDHQWPPRHLTAVLNAANRNSDRFSLALTTLTDHVASASTRDLPTWRGELRSGARTNLLMGVASNRVDVKIAAARAERALERVVEPLYALFFDRAQWPAALLDETWLHVLRNAAHDSICACSADEVVDAVLSRYRSAQATADALTDWALEHFPFGDERTVVVNVTAAPRSGLVEVIVADDDSADDVDSAGIEQAIEAIAAREVVHSVAARHAPVIVERELDIYSNTAFAIDIAEHEIVVRTAPGRGGELVVHDALEPVRALAHAEPEAIVSVIIERPPARRVLVAAEAVPAYGWSTLRARRTIEHPVRATDLTLDNGLARLAVDPTNATWSYGGVAGLGLLVDEGDDGDTYNFCPNGSPPCDRPNAVETAIVERGPLRGALRVTAYYDGFDATTVLAMHAGETCVRVATTIHNRARDHRVRACFPLPQSTNSSEAECAFAIVARGLFAEGGPTEAALATYPSRRFVRAGGLTIAHEGLLEYELVDIRNERAHALALTLLRCTGWLSRPPMPSRPLPAGPYMALEGPQMLGGTVVRYAVAAGGVDPYRMVDDCFVPLLVARRERLARRDEALEASARLEVAGAEISAIRRVPTDGDSAIEVRAFNPAPRPATLTMPGGRGSVHDLAGSFQGPFDGEITLAPGRIVTVRLEGH